MGSESGVGGQVMSRNGVAQLLTAPPAGVVRPGAAGRASGGRRFPKFAVVGADIVAVSLAMGLAVAFRPLIPGADRQPAPLSYSLLAVLSMPVWVGFFFHYRLYTARHVSSTLAEFGRIIHAVGASVVVLGSAGFMFKASFSRGWLALTFLFGVGLVAIERQVVRRVFLWQRRRGRLLRSVVIVGANVEGLALANMLDSDPGLGYGVVGFVDDMAWDSSFPGERPLLGTVDQALDAVRTAGASGVIIATTSINFEILNRLVRNLSEEGFHVELSSSLRDIAATRLSVRALGRFPVTYLEPVRRHGWRATAKRSFDVGVASVALAITSPLLAAIAVAIKVTSGGPVLFKQARLGQGGVPFSMLKFRTMVTESEERVAELMDRNEAAGPLFKIKDDPRVTRVGRFLRAFSLDELPQLLNVLRGRMSLVGPRPALASEVSGWTPQLHQRLTVKPGMTGMWQVHGRSDCSFDDYTRLDLFYVDNWSLWADLAILAKTVPVVLSRRGAS